MSWSECCGYVMAFSADSKKSLSGCRFLQFNSLAAPICYVCEQDTLSTLLQSTYLTSEFHHCEGCLFRAMNSPEEIALKNQHSFFNYRLILLNILFMKKYLYSNLYKFTMPFSSCFNFYKILLKNHQYIDVEWYL